MRMNKWECILLTLAGMQAAVEMIHSSLDPEFEREQWLMRQLAEIGHLLTLCVSHCYRSMRDGDALGGNSDNC